MTLNELFPVPQLRNCRRLLCIQPHPDDMDIGAGGTISYLTGLGTEIIYLTLTDDSAGFTWEFGMEAIPLSDRKRIRKAEQLKAGEILGVKDYYWLDYPDAGDWSEHEARNRIIKYIRILKPDFVLTVDPWLSYEAHRDHIKCGFAASEALLLYNFPHIKTDEKTDSNYNPYEIKGVAYCFTSRPNVIIDTGNYREKKFKALAEHKSQFTSESLEILKAYDEYRSRKLTSDKAFKFGEGFKVLHIDMLHVVPEAASF